MFFSSSTAENTCHDPLILEWIIEPYITNTKPSSIYNKNGQKNVATIINYSLGTKKLTQKKKYNTEKPHKQMKKPLLEQLPGR